MCFLWWNIKTFRTWWIINYSSTQSNFTQYYCDGSCNRKNFSKSCILHLIVRNFRIYFIGSTLHFKFVSLRQWWKHLYFLVWIHLWTNNKQNAQPLNFTSQKKSKINQTTLLISIFLNVWGFSPLGFMATLQFAI